MCMFSRLFLYFMGMHPHTFCNINRKTDFIPPGSDNNPTSAFKLKLAFAGQIWHDKMTKRLMMALSAMNTYFVVSNKRHSELLSPSPIQWMSRRKVLFNAHLRQSLYFRLYRAVSQRTKERKGKQEKRNARWIKEKNANTQCCTYFNHGHAYV